MLSHVQRHAPEEACGILAGDGTRVTQVYLVENELHSPVAYQMEPVQQVEAMIALESAGWDLCGIFHSHPAGPPVPSATDLAQAYYPDATYLIFAPTGSGWGLRGFSLANGRAQEVAVQIIA
jgi:[CysO sulfur-carrier protein]-S-L-cysteine hydrolase